MEGKNEMEKITPLMPETTDTPEKTVDQEKAAENPFAFEKECIAKLDEYLREQFPKTYGNPSINDWLKALHMANIPLKEYEKFQEALLEYGKSDDTKPFEFKIVDGDGKESLHTARKNSFGVYVDDPDYSRGRVDLERTLYTSHKYRASELFLLSVNLQEQNDTLTPDTAVERCKKILKGKQILSLGDDTGSLSEVLRHFGAEPIGVEHDPQKVAVGRAGIFSEDGKPNTSLIQGDIWDLVSDETELIKKLDGRKFDAIISVALFNGGSGGEMPGDALIRNKYKYFVEDWFNYFILQAQKLLKEKGCQIHLEIDTLSSNIESVLRNKKGIAEDSVDLKSWGDYSDNPKMNQAIEDLISSGKLELDPGGYRNLIVKK